MFEKGISAPEVREEAGVSRQVAYCWKSAWESGGGWLGQFSRGRKSKLTAEQTDVAVKALVAGPVSRGYKTNRGRFRVAVLIRDRTGPSTIPAMSGVCWATTGSGCQRPERRAIEF